MIFFDFNFFMMLFLIYLMINKLKKQMIDACRYYYQNNLEQIKLIDEFERDYQSDEAIHWYLNKSFLRKMINKALQIEDIVLLYRLQYFLRDLFENLAKQHQ